MKTKKRHLGSFSWPSEAATATEGEVIGHSIKEKFKRVKRGEESYDGEGNIRGSGQ